MTTTLREIDWVQAFNQYAKNDLNYNFGLLEDRVNQVYWDDLRFPATGINPTGLTRPPTLITTGIFTGCLSFTAGSDELIAGQAQMPHAWLEGSTIYPHIHWVPTGSNTGNVKWNFSYMVQNFGAVFPSSLTTDTILEASEGTQYKHQIAAFDGIDMSEFTISTMLIWQLEREGTHIDDTFTGLAYLMEFDIHYQTDTRGSIQAYIKE